MRENSFVWSKLFESLYGLSLYIFKRFLQFRIRQVMSIFRLKVTYIIFLSFVGHVKHLCRFVVWARTFSTWRTNFAFPSNISPSRLFGSFVMTFFILFHNLRTLRPNVTFFATMVACTSTLTFLLLIFFPFSFFLFFLFILF